MRIRDLLSDPLTPAEFLRRPFVRRSRWLIKAWDEGLQQFRQFYLGSSAEHESPGVLKVALYEPGEQRPCYSISRPFGPSRKERMLMAKAVAHWSQRELRDLQLRIYCDDLKVID